MQKELNPKALTWSHIRRFSYLQGIPKNLVSQVLREVNLHIKKNGEEWTVNRLKTVSDALRASYAHNWDKKYLAAPWVKKTRHGNLAGVWGKLQTYAKLSEKNFIKVQRLLKMSSAFIADEPTKKQINKFLNAVKAENKRDWKEVCPDLDKVLCNSAEHALSVFAPELLRKRFPKGRDVSTAPLLKESHDSRFLPEWMTWQRSQEGLHVMDKPWFQKFVTGPERLIDIMGFRGCYNEWSGHIGNIHVTQEPGFKLRCFAAPMIWTQLCLEPLKEYLMTALNLLPWDLTHDQRAADPVIQQALREHRMVYAFDLSNATDVIPMNLQIPILEHIIDDSNHHYIRLFEYVTNGYWKFSPTGETVKWNRGQPLGSGPSFGSFALWHGILLYMLNGNQWSNDFYIVGDDVVILDDNLAKLYETMLSKLDLDWSPLKTLSSSICTEFTGTFLTPNKVYKIPKWKRFTDDNFFDNLRSQGPAFMDMVPSSIKPAVEAIAALPEPWGLGYNPKGLSLEERLAGCEHLLTREPKVHAKDILPSERAMTRVRLLDEKWVTRFYDVFASRKFKEKLWKMDALEQSRAINFLEDEGYHIWSTDAYDLQSLLMRAEEDILRKASIPTKRVPFPISRKERAQIKRGKDRDYSQLKTLLRTWNELIQSNLERELSAREEQRCI